MRVVVGLGGEAMLGTSGSRWLGRAHVRAAARALAPIAREHELVVCHGGDPGWRTGQPAGADDATAAAQGLVGYWLVQELSDAGIFSPAVALVTRAVVSTAAPGHGPHRPERLVEFDTIGRLADRGTLVVCAGGGGIPLVPDGRRLHAAGFRVDVGPTAALLAVDLDADRLVLLSGAGALRDATGAAVERATVAEVRRAAVGPGGMSGAVEAGIRFVEGTGRPAAIGALADAERLVDGRAGTVIVPAGAPGG
jgi:carbamate kinase